MTTSAARHISFVARALRGSAARGEFERGATRDRQQGERRGGLAVGLKGKSKWKLGQEGSRDAEGWCERRLPGRIATTEGKGEPMA